MKIALLCGGPSLEKGISLNSARSVMDHLGSEDIEIVPIYFNFQKTCYRISKAQLYSNTPSDFDFKISNPLSEKSLIKLLKNVDLSFPVMHGPFGEDGEIQRFFEKNGIPFVGSGSQSCKKAFDKFIANEFIKQNGFFTMPSIVLKIFYPDHKKKIEKFFSDHKIKRAVVKPANGGSSIGVFSVSTPDEALEKTNLLFSKRMDTRVVVEPFVEGKEFTSVILENNFNLPVSLIPTEIETDYTENQIFDFRKKYLPTRQVSWHCPPRFSNEIVEKIRTQAEHLFSLFKMKDFGRFDGWVLPDGNIWFCDFNPISGMEQNSFLFQQASRIGMTHENVLRHIVKQACARQNIKFPEKKEKYLKKRKKVNIIMGGNTSERQVSLISGTNVWLKLRKSKKYEPCPYLLGPKKTIWKLPYHLSLNHTVEEIEFNCEKYKKDKKRLDGFEERIRLQLGIENFKKDKEFFDPQELSFKNFLKESNFVFIALHGGDGENGKLQKILSEKGIKFNGPDRKTSELCMDKWATSIFIKNLKSKEITSVPGKLVKIQDIITYENSQIRSFWKKTKQELKAETLIIKPRSDGCSTGIVRLCSSKDLVKYLELIKKKSFLIPRKTFKNQLTEIEMPVNPPKEFIFEKFIETDLLRIRNNKLKHVSKTGWIEVTIGVLEKNGKIKALNPSITVVENEVLTVEEKFQGGTGVNLTPPPKEIMKKKTVEKIKRNAEEVARKTGIKGYSRIDAFAELKKGRLMIIEINTLPGLTPSTVLYQQGLTEKPLLFPKQLLELIVRNKKY